MPLNCEFVSQVESDISLQGIPDLNPHTFEVSYFEEWAKVWTPWKKPENAEFLDKRIDWTLLSMSVARNFLYRKVRFKSQGSLIEVEFGRAFGEKCEPSGRSATGWKPRPVTIIETNHGPSL